MNESIRVARLSVLRADHGRDVVRMQAGAVLDETHPDRFVAIGQSDRGRLLVTVVVEKTYVIRIMSPAA